MATLRKVYVAESYVAAIHQIVLPILVLPAAPKKEKMTKIFKKTDETHADFSSLSIFLELKEM